MNIYLSHSRPIGIDGQTKCLYSNKTPSIACTKFGVTYVVELTMTIFFHFRLAKIFSYHLYDGEVSRLCIGL